jgi:hypothetical protein
MNHLKVARAVGEGESQRRAQVIAASNVLNFEHAGAGDAQRAQATIIQVQDSAL